MIARPASSDPGDVLAFLRSEASAGSGADFGADSRAGPSDDDLDWAWTIAADGTLYAASAPRALRGRAKTAVTELIDGTFETLRDQSFFVLRRPIWLSGQATPLCRGAVRLAAKRLIPEAGRGGSDENARVRRPGGKPLRSARPVPEIAAIRIVAPSEVPVVASAALAAWPERVPPSSDSDFLVLAKRLADQVERGRTLHLYDRPVAAIVASAQGEILSWGLNSNSVRKLRHAEYNAVRALGDASGGPLPRGARVYSTLKPCRLCAGAIWQASEDPASIRVIYAEDDPGALARGTALDVGSEERARASRDPLEVRASILSLGERRP